MYTTRTIITLYREKKISDTICKKMNAEFCQLKFFIEEEIEDADVLYWLVCEGNFTNIDLIRVGRYLEKWKG